MRREGGGVKEFGDGLAGEVWLFNFSEDDARARGFAEGDGDDVAGFKVKVGLIS